MATERRRYKRFTATAFLRMPVTLKPCPPFFGKVIKGRIIDLSAGGIALVIDEVIPINARLQATLKFPDGSEVDTVAQVRRLVPKDNKYMIGIEFQTISDEMQKRIDKMSSDYIDCESRIAEKKQEVCRLDCAFFSMCSKPQKINPVVNVNLALELTFKALEETAVS